MLFSSSLCANFDQKVFSESLKFIEIGCSVLLATFFFLSLFCLRWDQLDFHGYLRGQIPHHKTNKILSFSMVDLQQPREKFNWARLTRSNLTVTKTCEILSFAMTDLQQAGDQSNWARFTRKYLKFQKIFRQILKIFSICVLWCSIAENCSLVNLRRKKLSSSEPYEGRDRVRILVRTGNYQEKRRMVTKILYHHQVRRRYFWTPPSLPNLVIVH